MKLGSDFRTLWFGQTASLFGSAVTTLALPSVAILSLHATPLEVGSLNALQFAAFPILGLAVGVWADRTSRRPIMIAADILRAVVLAVVLLAALLNRLAFAQLAVAATILGIGSVFFEICYQSYLPTIVERSKLTAANSRLEFTRSVAQIGGNGVAGPIIAAIGAPLALGVDALSFIVSALSLALIRLREPLNPKRPRTRTSLLAELSEGLRVVFHSPVLRTIAACTATLNFGAAVAGAMLLIFAYRQLHLSPALMGIVLAGSIVGFAGATLATWFRRRLGLGVTLAASAFAWGIAALCLPLALIMAPAVVIFFVELAMAFVAPIYNISQVSLRQAMVPSELQGRMNATIRTFVWGALPLGAIIGGFLGNAIGSIWTIVAAGFIQLLAGLWIVTGPVIRLRDVDLAGQ